MDRYKNARTLDGRDIGRLVEQTVMDWSNAVWDREQGKYTVEPTTSKKWFPILMITHKKNGNVRVRTAHGAAIEFTGTTDIHLKDAE